MQFKVEGKPDSIPGDISSKYVELLSWQGVPVPMMD